MCRAPAFNQASCPFIEDFLARLGSIPRMMRFLARIYGFYQIAQVVSYLDVEGFEYPFAFLN